MVETSAGGHGLGLSSAPRKDFVESRLGADPPDSLVALHMMACGELAGAFGLHPELVGSATTSGVGQREQFRRWHQSHLKPLALRFAAELSMKFELDVTLTPDEMWTSDLRSITSSVKALAEAGLPVAEALTETELLARS